MKTLLEFLSPSGGGEKVPRLRPGLAVVSGAAHTGWVGDTLGVAQEWHFSRVIGSDANPNPLAPRGLLVTTGSRRAEAPHPCR